MKNYYDCLVVGAGVAGSTAAYHLAKLGYQVALLEKTLEPHHKVCGEFLSFEALKYIREMGISLAEDIPVIKYFQMFSRYSRASLTFPSPGRGVSRFQLDEELLNNARKAGACVIRGISMRNYDHDDPDLIRIKTDMGDFYTRHLFMATGKHDASREHKRRGKDHSYLGLKTHLHCPSIYEKLKNTTVLFLFKGGYGGICPIENGKMNFCFVINKDIYKSLNSNLREAVLLLRRLNPELDSVLRQSSFMEPWCAIGHIPYGFLRTSNPKRNVHFLGDQRMVIPSFTGDGMAIALSTARSCVDMFHQKGPGPQLRNEQNMLKKQMRWALGAHALMKSSLITEVCMSVPRWSSFLIRKFFQKTRIYCLDGMEGGYGDGSFESHYSRH